MGYKYQQTLTSNESQKSNNLNKNNNLKKSNKSQQSQQSQPDQQPLRRPLQIKSKQDRRRQLWSYLHNLLQRLKTQYQSNQDRLKIKQIFTRWDKYDFYQLGSCSKRQLFILMADKMINYKLSPKQEDNQLRKQIMYSVYQEKNMNYLENIYPGFRQLYNRILQPQSQFQRRMTRNIYEVFNREVPNNPIERNNVNNPQRQHSPTRRTIEDYFTGLRVGNIQDQQQTARRQPQQRDEPYQEERTQQQRPRNRLFMGERQIRRQQDFDQFMFRRQRLNDNSFLDDRNFLRQSNDQFEGRYRREQIQQNYRIQPRLIQQQRENLTWRNRQIRQRVNDRQLFMTHQQQRIFPTLNQTNAREQQQVSDNSHIAQIDVDNFSRGSFLHRRFRDWYQTQDNNSFIVSPELSQQQQAQSDNDDTQQQNNNNDIGDDINQLTR